jgi:uncharacterized low-complexity protein
MEKKNTVLKSSLVASVLMAAAGLQSNATTAFNYHNLGNGNTVRANLLNRTESSKTFEMKCAANKKADKADSTLMKKGKDGKCGEGKCGADKKKADSTKGKDATCAANKKNG